MRTPTQALQKYGLRGAIKRLPKFLLDDLGLRAALLTFRYSKTETYRNPSVEDLRDIELSLSQRGIVLEDYYIDKSAFEDFLRRLPFPTDYHGGTRSGVWLEKMLEHYNALRLLQLERLGDDEIYIDVAACNSPWAKILRSKIGLQAYAIDLEIPAEHQTLDYYRQCDATATDFEDQSVSTLSLQCAYEMFMKDDDVSLINEIARILKPNGRALINPLYMHTHYCCYATPEFYGKNFAPEGAREYVHLHAQGIRCSRKYDPDTLHNRILKRIEQRGLTYKLLVLKNKQDISPEIYCHFLLLISKPDA